MFNPPHLGHLALARAAADELGLSSVLLTPALVPPHKPPEGDPGAEHRANMCRLAVRGDARLGVCALELERAGLSYTVDTLRQIHERHPDTEITLILGADMARTLGSWREPLEILRRARIAVAERDGSTRKELLQALVPLGGEGRTAFLEMAPVDVSSSMVRERAAAGAAVDELVGGAVAGYIADHELYGIADGARAPEVGG